MDVDALLQTRGEDSPSGEDLEYDPEFTVLEITAQPGEERQVGDDILPAEDPDYKEVAKQAEAILERSHDLRAAIFYGEAQLRLTGFEGFAEATSYVRGCLADYWDSCHPQLDEDDGDPTMRRNVVLSLTDPKRILRGVRRTPLTRSRTFGAVSLRDIAVAEGQMTPPADMETVFDQAQIAAAFQDTDEEELAAIATAVAISLGNVQEIGRIFDEQTDGDGPNLDPLIDLLDEANRRLQNATGGTVNSEAVSDADGAEENVVPSTARNENSGAGTGAIHTPTDVQNALDRIIAYYERYEPSSPVPLLLLRAKRLVNADFLTIMKDMAPSGVDNVNLIGGIEDEDDY